MYAVTPPARPGQDGNCTSHNSLHGAVLCVARSLVMLVILRLPLRPCSSTAQRCIARIITHALAPAGHPCARARGAHLLFTPAD